jgi:hypothetical protein
MKPIFFLLLFSFNLSAQTNIKHVPKKVTKIILTTDQNQESNFDYMMNTLLDNGYTIEKRDSEYGTIKTDPQPLSGQNNCNYFFNIRVKDNQIIISGQYIFNAAISYGVVTSTPSWDNIINIGMNGSVNKITFIHMYEFAQSLTFTNKEYDY